MALETTRRYLSSLKIFNQYLEDNGLDILNVDRIVFMSFLDYLRKVRNVSQKTVENYFTAITGFYEFLEYEGYVGKIPVQSVRKTAIRNLNHSSELTNN